ncbi:hypothetical protein BTM25_04860 [Actinomadura rubteroloni]|uniref:VapC45 PIN like domain-containing protein n=1 Tax=Actinomadura rubteroloni TaxID=1926885 RepID=A0A2P4UM24_9ACTN|nr:hypothetical protein [Actinomadura rubteroloni]POM26098.1 hypothetical protein BTM25_04860 [Actinomadura rubteroloni]
MPQQEQQPRFFVDRSLGRILVPKLLRDAGWELITLAEHYGIPEDEHVADVEWIEEAARQGWPVLMKDKKIRYRRVEIEAVAQHEARCFVITRADLKSTEYAARLISNQEAILQAAGLPGPFIYTVHADRLDPLYPKDRTSE